MSPVISANSTAPWSCPDGKREVDYGAVVIATGGMEYQPQEYLYGQSPRVFTQTDMENLLAERPESLGTQPRVVMIQCVGSREPEYQYCSRTCCGEAVKNAITIKENYPAAQVFILYRDIRTYGLKEIYYKKGPGSGGTVRAFRFGAQTRGGSDGPGPQD